MVQKVFHQSSNRKVVKVSASRFYRLALHVCRLVKKDHSDRVAWSAAIQRKNNFFVLWLIVTEHKFVMKPENSLDGGRHSARAPSQRHSLLCGWPGLPGLRSTTKVNIRAVRNAGIPLSRYPT